MSDTEPLVEKKIKFRSISTTADPNYAFNKVDDMYLPRPRSKSEQKFKAAKEDNESDDDRNKSLFEFLGAELRRSYALEHDEEHYHARREKVYSFMKIPWEVEKFMIYGFLQCADSFLFVYTFLPVRLLLALWGFVTRPFRRKTGARSALKPAEICDLLKGIIILICSCCMTYIDTSIIYHLIKSQSIIKLYIFYNMLEVADRLFSAFGQDVIDALFWTSTEPRDRKRAHLGTIPHLCFALGYVFLHAVLVLCQATTLNVAINSSNKALLTIMMSNNFVELKGSVFKKFDKNNLFQVSCSDVRERFHLVILLFIVVLQTMKEYAWQEETLWVLVPDCLQVVGCEVLVDWIKHAFITRFNELPVDVYKDYTLSLAYDMAQTRQKNAYSDHSDLVARRMGFIPLPLGVVMIRVLVTCVKFQSLSSIIVGLVAYLALFALCVNNNLAILWRACVLIESHQQTQEKEKENEKTEPCLKDFATSPTRPVSHLKPVEHPTEITNLGSTAIFANSTVSMNDVHLNEELLRVGVKSLESIGEGGSDQEIYRSEPNIQFIEPDELANGLKRAESEPSIPSAIDTIANQPS